MSQKNHKMIDGKLLQTDKKYSHLKLKQKVKVAEWMYLETRAYYEKAMYSLTINIWMKLYRRFMTE